MVENGRTGSRIVPSVCANVKSKMLARQGNEGVETLLRKARVCRATDGRRGQKVGAEWNLLPQGHSCGCTGWVYIRQFLQACHSTRAAAANVWWQTVMNITLRTMINIGRVQGMGQVRS